MCGIVCVVYVYMYTYVYEEGPSSLRIFSVNINCIALYEARNFVETINPFAADPFKALYFAIVIIFNFFTFWRSGAQD